MKTIRHVALSFCILLAALSGATGTNVQANELKPIQISAGEWPPFLSQSLPGYGSVARLITDVFSEAGYDVEFVFLPWVRAYNQTATGRYSATAVWMYQEERSEDYYFSDPVLNETFVLFSLSEDPFDWQSLDDLEGLTVGGGLGYSYGPEFDKALEDGVFEMLRQANVEQNLRMLVAGRIDLFAEEKSIAYYTLNNNAPELADQITHHPTPILENQSFLMLPKSEPDSLEIMRDFNAQLQVFKDDGRYQTYFD